MKHGAGFWGLSEAAASMDIKLRQPRHLGAAGGRNRPTTPTPKPVPRGMETDSIF